MSLLDRRVETVVVYPEIMVLDEDGNEHTKASDTGFVAYATIQNTMESGTSARRAEQDNEGYESENSLSIRFTRGFEAEHGFLGAQSEIEWDGNRWTIFGAPQIFNGSPRTKHVRYSLKRS